jgi:hypothetical protein
VSENDKDVKRLVLALLDAADAKRMTPVEQDALARLVRMTWRWESEDKL